MKQSLGHRIADMVVNDYIANGLVKPGERLPTVCELKQEYSTSDTTIQRALSILELNGLVDKRHGSGCYVSDTANNEVVKSAKLIGCVSSFNNTVVMMRSYEGIERICSKRGYNMVVANTQDNYETERAQVKKMIEMGVQAIIVYPVPRSQKQLQQDYLRSENKNFPIVLLDTGHPEQKRPMVAFDNYRAGYDMTQLLIGDGHRRIAFMLYDHVDSELLIKPINDRYRGFLDALDSAGIRFRAEDRWFITGQPAKNGVNNTNEPVYRKSHKDLNDRLAPILDKWRKDAEHPTALITIEDSFAEHVIRLAQRLKINVPNELEVVGFDNLLAGNMPITRFPTTNPDYTRAGEIAAEMAIDYAKGNLSQTATPIYMLPVPILSLHSNFDQLLPELGCKAGSPM